LILAVIAQHSQFACENGIIRGDATAIAHDGEIFSTDKTKTRLRPIEPTRWLADTARQKPGRNLATQSPCFFGPEKFLHVSRMPVRWTGRIPAVRSLIVCLEKIDIDAVVSSMSMKTGRAPDESSVQLMETQCAMERNFVAGANSHGVMQHQGAGRPRRTKDRFFRPDVGSQLGFERFALLSEDVPARIDRATCRLTDFVVHEKAESGTFSFRSARLIRDVDLFSQPEEFVSLVASVTADQQSRHLVRSISWPQ